MPPSTHTELPTHTITPTLVLAATSAPTYQVNLQAVGDIMLGRSVGDRILANGPEAVFSGVQSALDPADILVGNLECVLTERAQSEHKAYTLKAPPAAAEALSLAGFDVLSLANNHALDYGFAGLQDTQANLGQYGIATVGAGLDSEAAHTPLIISRNGLRLAFLAYVDVIPELSGYDLRSWIATSDSPGIAWADLARIKADVTAARRDADLVIVLLHGGIEISEFITNITNAQREQAHAAIDAGAAVVIGSHTHVLQQIERYHGGLIAYSLGNFVFDQYAGIANATIILRVGLGREGVMGYDFVPALIDGGLPHIITDEQIPAIGTLVAPPKP
jgi:poly-gamma-glutamate capsule biosynthesis protein CapA/YwtB (metallophosphatase superfamily)